jgi:hypothetical protein
MNAARVCDPRFDDGVDYLCFRVVEKLERNRAESNPLRYTTPEGTAGFLCEGCLVELLKTTGVSGQGEDEDFFEPLP